MSKNEGFPYIELIKTYGNIFGKKTNLKTKTEYMRTFLSKIVEDLGVEATKIDIASLCDVQLLAQVRDEIPTLNKTGYMKQHLDEYSQAFVDYSSTCDDYVLEIGCAYGFVVQEALKKGAKVVASDLSEEHLIYLLKNTKEEYLNNLVVNKGYFPFELDLPWGSMSAVLASRVLHFLDGDELEEALDKIFGVLKENGKFYFTCVTPYHESIRARFLHTYDSYLINGVKWPGLIDDPEIIDPIHNGYMDKILHVFDKKRLVDLLPEHGFEIEKIGYFQYPGDTTSGPKGHIGLIARKDK